MNQQSMDVEAVRRRLMARREELQTRLAAVQHDRRRTAEPLSPDWAEQATQRENDDVVDAIGTAVQSELASISDALQRIDVGTYGFCRVCGSAISAARLGAVPYAERCSRCASSVK